MSVVMRRRVAGFTLIEIMIAVVIVGVLAAFAIPSYQQYVTRSNRTEGIALLNDAAARQERFFAQTNRYVTDDDDIADLGLSTTSPNGLYELTVADGDGGYELTATPQGMQAARDTGCANLTLDGTGERGASAVGADVAQCWR